LGITGIKTVSSPAKAFALRLHASCIFQAMIFYKREKKCPKIENIISTYSADAYMGDYVVKCVACDAPHPPYALGCQCGNSLLRAEYSEVQLKLLDLPGMWKFYNWLPVHGIIRGVGEGSITYRSDALARELGLKNLFISFSGFWPEKGALMKTCSFKDLEAPPTMQRLREKGDQSIMVVASAGNTARAFAHVASIAGQKLVLVVPEASLHRLWTTVTPGKISLIGVRGDYFDAIQIADKITSCPGFISEGGARNIARRDGMGTVMLEAAQTINRLPDHYFQAVGSGTGGIAAWEASIRLIKDGRFGEKMPRLHLGQNLPNAPIYCAWACEELGIVTPECMYDDVLFNRRPPYALPGGVKDALDSTNGRVYGVTNQEAQRAKSLFESSEEIDILNAPGVAIASLIKALESGDVGLEDIILLNVTGGGISRLKEDFCPEVIKPGIIVSNYEEAIEFLGER
jgi:cysteate synthase